MIDTQEFVVPKSIPITLLIIIPFHRQIKNAKPLQGVLQKTIRTKPNLGIPFRPTTPSLPTALILHPFLEKSSTFLKKTHFSYGFFLEASIYRHLLVEGKN
jgi:hypothetical protein